MNAHRFLTAITLGLLAGFGGARVALAQELVERALQRFPADTVRVEYSSSEKLRALPDYAKLRDRYLGPRLKKLEASLAELGIREQDVNELVLGWKPGSKDVNLAGVAAGIFDAGAIESAAASHGIVPRAVDTNKVYCLSAEADATCIVLVSAGEGVFGPLDSLTSMLKEGSGLSSNSLLTRLLSEANRNAPIWGVALGPGVADWFKSSMPGQENLKLDWQSTFQGVEGIVYSVEAAEDVRLGVRLDCQSSQVAANMRQLFEGLKILQRLAWQSQNPTLPNPYDALEVETQGTAVNLKLTTPYSVIEAARTGPF